MELNQMLSNVVGKSSTCPTPSRKCEDCGNDINPFEIELFGVKKWMTGNCKCVTDKYDRELEEQKQKEKQDRLDRIFKQSRLGERFKNSTFQTYTATAETRPFATRLYGFAKNFRDNKNKSILMTSHPGTGKTLLASCVVNELLSKGIPSIFVIVPDLLTQIRATYNRNSLDTEGKIMSGLSDCELLVLDDIGAERHSDKDDWATEKLFSIINSRYIGMKATIFTTNCTLAELKEKLGDRTFSRICEMTEGMRLDMNTISDFRLSGLR